MSEDRQPFVEQDRRGARVQRRRSPGLTGQTGRESLVIQLDGDLHGALQALRERPRLRRLGRVGARQRQRQPDDDPLRAELARRARRTRAKPLRVPGRRTGSSGVASVPVGSLTAAPQRALP